MGGGAWDRELTNRDDEAAKRHAFADAVSVMCHVWTAPAVQGKNRTFQRSGRVQPCIRPFRRFLSMRPLWPLALM